MNLLLLLVSTWLLSLVKSFPVINPQKRDLKFLSLDFSITENSDEDAISNSRSFYRMAVDNHLTELIMAIENKYSLYVAKLQVGNPPQEIEVQIDTGSSDLWLPAPETTKEFSTFSTNVSSTVQYVHPNQTFYVKYGDRSHALGKWVTDNVRFGGINIDDLMFGYATEQNAGQGVLGIGLKQDEVSTWTETPFTYDNFPFALKKHGYISKAAYSLFLNSADADKGSILFGAVDKAKFSGEMKWLPVLNIDFNGMPTPEPTNFFVTMDKISNGNDTFLNKSLPVLLDAGTTLSYAPYYVVNDIGHKYGKYNSMAGGYILPCNTTGPPVSFHFGDTTVNVPLKDLLYDLHKENEIYEENTCLIGILNSGKNSFILGDSFLRSAYIIYDLEKTQCGIAQAVYTGKSDIQAIE